MSKMESIEWAYIEARKKAQKEIDELNEKLALIKEIKQYPTALAYISELKEELKRERSAVDFYANKVHWEKFTEAYSEYDYESRILCAMDCIIEYDVEIFEGKVFAARDHSVGGKLARQTQQQRRIDL